MIVKDTVRRGKIQIFSALSLHIFHLCLEATVILEAELGRHTEQEAHEWEMLAISLNIDAVA